jgi:hypothetical protein
LAGVNVSTVWFVLGAVTTLVSSCALLIDGSTTESITTWTLAAKGARRSTTVIVSKAAGVASSTMMPLPVEMSTKGGSSVIPGGA